MANFSFPRSSKWKRWRERKVVSPLFCDVAQGKSCTPKKQGKKFFINTFTFFGSLLIQQNFFMNFPRRSINITNYNLIKFSLQKGFDEHYDAATRFYGRLLSFTPINELYAFVGGLFNCLRRNYGFSLLFALRDFSFLSSSFTNNNNER